MKKTMKQQITFEGPVLPGSVSTARSQCGKMNCACKGRPPRLHGTYYRWTGVIDGKRTTKTISRQTALECQRRIRNFRKLKRELETLTRASLRDAPWTSQVPKSKKRENR